MHIYLAKLPIVLKEEVIAELAKELPIVIRQRIKRYRQLEDKYRTLLGYLLLKRLLADVYDIQDLNIAFGEFGKPYLSNHTLYFNISHSGQMVLCGISDRNIGVDIEQEKDTKGLEQIVKRFCTENEYKQVSECEEEKKASFFYKLWTGKESYMKYIGQGLLMKLDSFELSIGENKTQLVKQDINKPCYFKYYGVAEHYHIHICCEKNNFPKSIEFVNLNELMP